MKLCVRIIILIVISVFTILMAIDRINLEIDDSYISLRYVYNLLHGYGMVFNPGERIEAISNPTWTWLLTIIAFILKKTDLLSIVLLAKFSGLALHIIGTIIFFSIIFHITRERLWAIFFTLFYSLHPYVSLYSIAGLENSLINLMMILWLYFFIRFQSTGKYFLLSFIPLLVLSISRPEGLIYIVTLVGSYVFFPHIMGKKPSKLNFCIIISLMLLSSITVARYFYFGDLLPNTVYAKNYFSFNILNKGMRYIFDSFAYLLVGLIPIIAICKKDILKEIPINLRRVIFIIAPFIFVQIAFVLYVGGDWMPKGRFLLVILPLIIFIVGVMSRVNYSQNNKNKLFAILTLVITIAFNIALARYDLAYGNDFKSGLKGKWKFIHNDMSEEVIKIKELAPKNAVILTDELGIIPFYNPELLFIDLSGLINKHISKKVRGEHFFRLAPEYFAELDYDYFISFGTSFDEKNELYMSKSLRYDSILKHPNFLKNHKLIFHNDQGMYIFKKEIAFSPIGTLLPYIRHLLFSYRSLFL